MVLEYAPIATGIERSTAARTTSQIHDHARKSGKANGAARRARAPAWIIRHDDGRDRRDHRRRNFHQSLFSRRSRAHFRADPGRLGRGGSHRAGWRLYLRGVGRSFTRRWGSIRLFSLWSKQFLQLPQEFCWLRGLLQAIHGALPVAQDNGAKTKNSS